MTIIKNEITTVWVTRVKNSLSTKKVNKSTIDVHANVLYKVYLGVDKTGTTGHIYLGFSRPEGFYPEGFVHVPELKKSHKALGFYPENMSYSAVFSTVTGIVMDNTPYMDKALSGSKNHIIIGYTVGEKHFDAIYTDMLNFGKNNKYGVFDTSCGTAALFILKNHGINIGYKGFNGSLGDIVNPSYLFDHINSLLKKG